MKPLARALVAALALAACSKDPAPAPPASAAPRASSFAPRSVWPELPTSEASAKSLIGARTRRSPSPEPPLDAATLGAAVQRAAEKDQLRAGFASIGRAIAERSTGHASSFVLFGTFHDAKAQLVAFRQLFGPLGFAATDATLEQFHAGGRWQSAEVAGDDAALERFGKDGDRPLLEALLAAQRDHDYSAWKFDYVEEVLALAATLRASGVALRGCDMPRALQDRVRAAGDESLSRLRELHCVLALEDALAGRGAKVAMLWGAEHVASGAVQRFLPADAAVTAILVVGGRDAEGSIELALGKNLTLTSPLLVPIEGKDRFALVLPDGNLRASVDRVRTASDPARLGKLEATADADSELFVEGKSSKLPASLALAPGDHAFLLVPKKGPRVAGLVPMPARGSVELGFDSKGVRLVVHGE